jgi:hypothetical protein
MNGLSPPNGRSTPVIRKLDEVLFASSSFRDLAVAGIHRATGTSPIDEQDSRRVWSAAPLIAKARGHASLSERGVVG